MRYFLRLVLLLICLITFDSRVFAVENSLFPDSIPRYSTLVPFTLKLNIPCLIDPFRQSLYVGSDLKLSPKISMDVALGWYFNSENVRFKDASFNGVGTRVGLKYFYLENSTVMRRRVSPYFGVEAKFNHIVENNFETVCRYGCQYTEILDVQYKRTVYGLSAKYGFHLMLGKQRKWFFDFYGGLGYRNVDYKRGVLPTDAEEFGRRGLFEGALGNFSTPDILLGFYFGYRFLPKQ